MTRILTPSVTTVIDLTQSGLVEVDTQAPVLRGDLVAQSISGGARVTAFNLGTINSGTLTPDSGNGPLQYLTNNGVFTVQSPIYDGSLVISITNGITAGNITFSGFNVGGNIGDSYNTVVGNIFFLFILRINGRSTYTWKATQ
jgi:hypothetical protein